MDPKILLETISQVPWGILFQLSIVAIIGLILKRYYDNFASYFMFRANKDLGKNVKVRVNGDLGYIIHYSWRFIYVKLETGNELVIPITRWTAFRWEICRNGHDVEGK